jgi:hypothetical protein
MSEIHEIWRHNICPHIILKNIWTIKSIICQRFFYFSYICCVSYTWNHSKYPSFNIIISSLYHFQVRIWGYLLIEWLLVLVTYLQFSWNFTEAQHMSTCNPQKCLDCKFYNMPMFYHFTSTCCVSYTRNHSKYPSFNISNTSLFHFHMNTWYYILIECLFVLVT